MAIGKLYNMSDKQFLAEVEYQCFDESQQNWWGELTLTEFQRLQDGSGYVIELQDRRQGNCSLKKKVNRAVLGLAPLFCYHFKGTGLLG
jgi:hypothetical protein